MYALCISQSLLADRIHFEALKQIVMQCNLALVEESYADPLASINLQKLMLFCGRDSSLPRIKLWSALDLDLIDSLLAAYFCNVILSSRPLLPSHTNTLSISCLGQLKQLLALPSHQLLLRIRLERMIRSSEQKHAVQEAQLGIRRMAIILREHGEQRCLKVLNRFMCYYERRTRAIWRRMFLVWAISTYETALDRINEEVVAKKYFMEVGHRQLLWRCFIGWKAIPHA